MAARNVLGLWYLRDGQKLYLKLILTEGKSEEIFSSFLIISSFVMLTCNRKDLQNFFE